MNSPLNENEKGGRGAIRYVEPVLTDAQLLDLRTKRIDWFSYCLWRQTLSHDEAVTLLADRDNGQSDGDMRS